MQVEYADVSSDEYYNKWSDYEKLSFVCSYCLFISFQEFFILEIFITMYFCWDKQQNIHSSYLDHHITIFIWRHICISIRPASMQLKWFKSRPLRPSFKLLFYTSVEINLHICSTSPFLPPSLKRKGKSTLAYMQHIFLNWKWASG